MLNALSWLSWTLTFAGITTLSAAAALNLNPVFVLAGFMLVLTGIVKIVVIRLWTNVIGLGTEQHDPIPPD
jgi:hypothetical protein